MLDIPIFIELLKWLRKLNLSRKNAKFIVIF